MQGKISWTIGVVCTVSMYVSFASFAAADPLLVTWKTQVGTSMNDGGLSVAVAPSGATYVTGYTMGDFAGPSAGSTDVYLGKFDTTGAELWRKQFGTDAWECGECVAVDASGNVWVTGQTEGTLIGSNAGYTDAFLVKFDANGNELWREQFGKSYQEEAFEVALNAAGEAYVVGHTDGLNGAFPDSPVNASTFEGFLTKYNTNGTQLWYIQFPDWGSVSSVAIDAAGAVFVVASGETSLLVKFDADGNELWRRPLGPGEGSYARAVAVDASGAAYVAGNVNGLREGCYLTKFNGDGDSLWTRQWQTSGVDGVRDVAVDDGGSAHVAGHGDHGDFLASYDTDGNQRSLRIIGPGSVNAYAVDADSAGAAYVAGHVFGEFAGPCLGRCDVLLMKYTTEGFPGDIDEDCDVDLKDFVILKANFGSTTATRGEGDLDGDGDVDLDDFRILKNNFGSGS